MYYFGIDGGGTRSRIALSDGEGRILLKREGGSANIYSVSPQEALEHIRNLIEEALRIGEIDRREIAGGCIGSAGLGREPERRLFRDFLGGILPPETPVILCTDGEILLCGGLGGPEGYCLIAGTGSFALGRSAGGTLVRAGGLGYLLGDEGAAAWIGKTAIARSLRSLEGRDISTDLMGRILEAAGLREPPDLIAYVHRDADKAKVAALAPLVTAAARQGDPLARDILHTGAVELVLLLKSVRERTPEIRNRELVLAGGVLEHDEVLRGDLERMLARECPDIILRNPQGSALEGACLLARRIPA